MHCIYPAYLCYNFEPDTYWLRRSCKDKSDQIHKVNASCTADTYIDTYCKTFCPEGVEILTYHRNNIPYHFNTYMANKQRHSYFINKDGKHVWRGTQCDSLCSNASASKNSAYKHYMIHIDHHHCQDSCAEPGYGCQACTNKSYFHCKINGEEHCLHPELECDGHSVCDEGEDEQLPGCYDKLVRLGNIDEAATMVCKSIQYPGQ